MKTYIINIEFNSNKYNEQGVLTYKTIAESREQAEENHNRTGISSKQEGAK